MPHLNVVDIGLGIFTKVTHVVMANTCCVVMKACMHTFVLQLQVARHGVSCISGINFSGLTLGDHRGSHMWRARTVGLPAGPSNGNNLGWAGLANPHPSIIIRLHRLSGDCLMLRAPLVAQLGDSPPVDNRCIHLNVL